MTRRQKATWVAVVAMRPRKKEQDALSLDGRILHVVAADGASEVDARTVMRCRQKGQVVTATYRGGRVRAGFLIGRWADGELACDYLQVSTADVIDKGHSVCRVTKLSDGRLRLEERYTWESRSGTGLNVFEEK